jgi:Zn-finger nucleic acid-binding protein
MPVETLHCPACGALVSSDSTRCDFCGATLATVACPSCFGMMFVGAKFCSHCGTKANRVESAGGEPRLCPRCKIAMKTVTVGSTTLLECGTCEGIWVGVEALQQICAEREKQAAVLGMPAPPDTTVGFETQIRYVPCPDCKQLMNRVNFAQCSHVIVDVCKAHGTWFDKDELRRVVEFIRAGGLEKSRAQQLQKIKDEQRALAAVRVGNIQTDAGMSAALMRDTTSLNGIGSTAIDLLFQLLK